MVVVERTIVVGGWRDGEGGEKVGDAREEDIV
jgi:hypothetical protein